MTKKIILFLTLILLTATNVEAAEDNLPFDVLAGAYSENGNECSALIKMKSNGTYAFMTLSKDLGSIGIIAYSRKVYDFYLNKGQAGYSPLILNMLIPQENRGQLDDDLGEWDENLHIIPIYALFDVVGGQIVCQKPFYSAGVLNPSHYHSSIKNPKHERLVEIFMTLMPRLHEVVASKNISLP